MASEQAVNRLHDRKRSQRLSKMGSWVGPGVGWIAVIAMCGAVVWVLLYTPAY